MPQLDTSTWFITILSMFLSLFVLFQTKLSSFIYYSLPTPKLLSSKKLENPWNSKWTKIYLPLSLPLHS
uniref:ATP synthase complex subunit 8 n=1 Tax=Dipus sagitta TaxID=73863 RepID=A0A0U2D8J6_DIPSA|nr:ATP synthase F0 subunit 8 [Dipus sagitta]AKN58256.1 ATP synthase F0 subunit 8 [Dipus sagitta]